MYAVADPSEGAPGTPTPLKLEYMLRPLSNWKVLDPRLNEAYIGHTCVHGTHVEHDLIKCCQAACEQSVALFILRSFVKQFVSMQATAVSCNEPTHLGEIAFKTVKGGGGIHAGLVTLHPAGWEMCHKNSNVFFEIVLNNFEADCVKL